MGPKNRTTQNLCWWHFLNERRPLQKKGLQWCLLLVLFIPAQAHRLLISPHPHGLIVTYYGKYPSILSLLTTDLDPFEWLAMSATASKRLHRRQGRGGARTMTQIIQFLIRSVTKDVEEDPTSSSVVHLPFATGHVPLGQMMPPPPLQIISAAAARGKGARWGFFLPLNLFWICRNGRAGCKSNSILQCSNYACKSRCWESESDFWPWVNSRNHAEFPFLFGFKQFKMTPKWIMNDTNSTDVDLWRQLSQ